MANYTFLVEDIIGATENDGTEFLNYIPKIVNRAEERLTNDLDDYGLVAYTSVAISANNNMGNVVILPPPIIKVLRYWLQESRKENKPATIMPGSVNGSITRIIIFQGFAPKERAWLS